MIDQLPQSLLTLVMSTLIRFSILATDPDSGHRSGILVVAHELRDDGALTASEHERLRVLLAWFTANLPVPSVLEDIEHRRAISWFKPSAAEAIRRMWELKAVLEEHGHHVAVLRTELPGAVVYEDDWQVVSKPPKGVRY
ncbi:MAG: hypothetical protein MEQ07_00755 [Aquimonas sp.]|nr:hypothetical protein [Aquimonas sp.]